MAEDREERIRRRAHEIWERDGRPEGLGEVHWLQASREIDAEDQATADQATAKPSGRPRRQRATTEGSITSTVRRSAKKATQVVSDAVTAVVETVSETVAPKQTRGRKKTSAAAGAQPNTEAPAKPARGRRATWSPSDIKPGRESKAGNGSTRKAATSISAENTEPAPNSKSKRRSRAGVENSL